MPKIINYNEVSEESLSTQLANPQLWGWNDSTMYPVKEVNGYTIIGDFNDCHHTLYGLFQKGSNQVLSAIDVKIETGNNFDILMDNVAVVENIATVESQRGKGYARILYDYIINKFKILVSDSKIFTNGINISKTLGIWKNYISSISKTFNYNTKTHKYSEFNVETGNSEDIRFVAVKDDSTIQKITKSFKNSAIKGVASLALIGSPSIVHNDEYPNYCGQLINLSLIKDVKPQIMTLNVPAIDITPLVKPAAKPVIKPNKIDVNIISIIESNNRRKAVSPCGAKGLCQLKKDAWDETQIEMFGTIKYSFEKYAFNSKINKDTADYYYNEILPDHLQFFRIPKNTDTLLASYNYGSNNVKHLIRKYGKNWKKHLPSETKNYIISYKNLVEK